MAVDLKYKHQQKTYKLIKEELKRSKRAAYEFPTGCGKTFPGLKYIDENPDETVLVIVPSTTIKAQWQKYIKTYIDNGAERLRNKNIAIVTYQKVALLMKKVKNLQADTIIVDELHRMGAETWEPAIDTLIESNPDTKVIAMTATPKRTDKRNMAEEKFGENIVYEMSLTEALSGEKEGEVILKSPRYVKVLSELLPKISEYKEKILQIEDEEKRKALLKKYERIEGLISNSPGLQDVMATGMQKKNGKYIVFCKDRQDMIEKMAQAQRIFGKVNSRIHAEYVLTRRGKGDKFGKTEVQNRKTIESFERLEPTDQLQLLFCVDKLNEGVHIEGIDGVVLFDLTNSPVLYKQRIGRATTPDKETVIIDAVNNWLAQIDTYIELDTAIRRGRGGNSEHDYELFNLSPEETELLEILREIGEELTYNNKNIYEEMIAWLSTHNGEMPRAQISRDGKKNLNSSELSDEERKERNLYYRWNKSREQKILKEYEGKPLEEVPEEYREKVKVLREFGYGITSYEQIIKWLETHEGKMPRGQIRSDKKAKKAHEMTEEENREKILYDRWIRSEEYKILNEYAGREIEEVPEEYREKIRVLREYGYGYKEKAPYEQIIEWLETHEGKMPRGQIRSDKKAKKAHEMTEEENRETNLYRKWTSSKEYEIMNKYVGKALEEVPEEYREKIGILRSYGYGLEEKTIYEKMVEWLESHDGKMPKSDFFRDGRRLKPRELSNEEREEVNLYKRWQWSVERKILDEYAGRPIEEVPEEYREKISKLRSLGQLGKKKDEKIKSRMKQSVGRRAKNNSRTREEVLSKRQVDGQATLDDE